MLLRSHDSGVGVRPNIAAAPVQPAVVHGRGCSIERRVSLAIGSPFTFRIASAGTSKTTILDDPDRFQNPLQGTRRGHFVVGGITDRRGRRQRVCA